MTTVFVDADACPVRNETIRVAERHGLEVKIVSNGGLRPSEHPLVEMVNVPDGPDIADDWIVEHMAAGDICITTDVPLAERCVKKDGCVLTPSGEELDAKNIGMKSAMRDLATDMRAASPLNQGGGAKPFSKADRSRFLNALDRVLVKAKKRTG